VKTRFDKIVIMREVASRAASGAYSKSAARVARLEALTARLDAAAVLLTSEPGSVSGEALGAQMELAGRMRAAREVAQLRVEDALAERAEASVKRQAARRALDAAKDIRRVDELAQETRREARTVPLVTKDRS
jgi:hypothetical protein